MKIKKILSFYLFVLILPAFTQFFKFRHFYQYLIHVSIFTEYLFIAGNILHPFRHADFPMSLCKPVENEFRDFKDDPHISVS